MVDDWLTDIEVSHGGGPPAGNYRCEFVGVRRTTHEEYGEGLRFEMKVLDGPHAGAIASRTTSARPTPGNAAGRLLAQITGANLAGGQKASVRDAVGRVFLVIVETTKSGAGTRIGSVIAAPTA
jgi:hypothetical protein